MSIQSEITRISGNVSDALTAIGNKGVTVPTGSNSDDLADLIAQIQTGGDSTRETVIPSQTITASTTYNPITNYAKELVLGEQYICTVDGVEYGPYYGIDSYGSVAIGDISTNMWVFEYDRGMYFTVQDTSLYGSHTVKVEKVVESGGSGDSGMNVQAYMGMDYVAATSYTATDVTLTVKKTGTYTVSWMGFRNTTSGTSGSQLYVNGTATGSAQTTFTRNYGQNPILTGIALNEGDVLVVRAISRSASYYMYVGNLVIEQTA